VGLWLSSVAANVFPFEPFAGREWRRLPAFVVVLATYAAITVCRGHQSSRYVLSGATAGLVVLAVKARIGLEVATTRTTPANALLYCQTPNAIRSSPLPLQIWRLHFVLIMLLEMTEMLGLTTCDCDLPWCLSEEAPLEPSVGAFLRCDGSALFVVAML